MSDLSKDLVIDDANFHKFVDPSLLVDGKLVRRGLIPRDFSKFPRGFYASARAIDVPLKPRADWPELIKEKEAKKTRTSDIRMKGDGGNPIAALDQNGQGYCWSYSTTACVQLIRAVNNQPYVPLSAHGVACVIKKFKDEGGWGALSLDFIQERGIPPQSLWPQQSMSRAHDTPATWEAAKEFRVTEGWVDLAESIYDRNLTFDQVASLLLVNTPVVGDFNWWGHSICLMDLVEVDANRSLDDIRRWGIRELNSWSNQWGTLGTSVLVGSKAVPDGAVAPRAVAGN